MTDREHAAYDPAAYDPAAGRLTEVSNVTFIDRDQAFATMVTAFASDPVVRWAFPEPATYLSVWPQFCAAYAGAAFEDGEVDALDDGRAVAMWLPPGIHSDEATMDRLVRETAPDHVLRDLDGFFEQMGETHPQFEHWYLPLIGVDPTAQGRGLGSELLRLALARADAAGLPCYLEATSAGSRDLYARFGFQVRREIQHGDSPAMWAMLRPAQGSRRAR